MSAHAVSAGPTSIEELSDIANPSPEQIRTQVELMMSRPEFDASARNRRFLSYVVEETLCGRACRIKAYTIALAVFDRGDDFDPTTDPIVRIEASRLRRAIEHYYLTAGRHDRIRVDMPKGSYVPTFAYGVPDVPSELLVAATSAIDAASTSNTMDALPAPAESRQWPTNYRAAMIACLLAVAVGAYFLGLHRGTSATTTPNVAEGPSIMVMPLQSVDPNGRNAYIATGMTYEIISQLTRFEDFFVFGPQTAQAAASGGQMSIIRQPKYILSGTVQTSDTAIRINVVLSDQATGHSIWAWSQEEPLSSAAIMDVTQSISQKLVNLLAQPDGVIADSFQREISRKPANELTSYECIVSFRAYWRSYGRDKFKDTQACLERTVAAEPAYGPAYSALALMNVDRYRFGFDGGDTDGSALLRAEALARKATELEPRASQPYLALSLALWFQHHVDESLAAAERGLALNPNNAEQLADLGLRYALLGKWDRAMALVNDAYRRDPLAPSGYRVAHFLHYYMMGDYRQALSEAEKIGAQSTLYGHIARAAAFGELGQSAKAAMAVADILRIDPGYGSKMRSDLAKRNMAPEIIDALVDGVRKAGLSI